LKKGNKASKMLNSKSLNEVIKDPKKALFLSKNKINLTFCDIETIDGVPKTFHQIEKLHLSHNKLVSLDGIQQFKNITHLSLSYNLIKDHEELDHVVNREALVELNIKGNPFTANPNHLFLTMDKFPKLQRIDDLKIPKEDRYYLRNYWLLSGKILPLFIQLKNDLDLIEENLQRMRLTAEIRGRERTRTNQDKRENLEKLEELYLKMTEEFKNDQFLVEVHRILEKYSRFQSQSPTLTLRIIDTIVQSLYENRLENTVFDRKELYVSYRKLFNDVMLRYFSINDTSIDRFLTQKVLDTPTYDHWKFAEDSDYAFDCVLYEFYKLMPNQASISHTLQVTFTGQGESQRVNKWDNPRDKVITSLDVSVEDPDFLRNVSITHFPVFPLNLQYNNMLLKTILGQLDIIQNATIEIYSLLGANSPALNNLGTYKLFLESRLQQRDRERSLTPPGQYTLYNSQAGELYAKKLAGSLSPNRTRSPLGTIYENGSGTKNGKRSFYLIPDKSANKENLGSGAKSNRSRSKSPTHQFGSSTRGKSMMANMKTRLPLMLIMKFETDTKFKLREAFYDLKYHARNQESFVRKRILQEFYQQIKDKMDLKLKTRVLKGWRRRTETTNLLYNHVHETRANKLAKYFRLFKQACEKSRFDINYYYTKNLALKVFYSILNMRMKKRLLLKKIVENVTERKHRIMKIHLSKWRIMNSVMKYSFKKTGTSKSFIGSTLRKRQDSEDGRRYKDLKEEAMRLQNKKTMRELEPYFARGRDIFRKCGACDYDL
jgi:hypothetical protein